MRIETTDKKWVRYEYRPKLKTRSKVTEVEASFKEVFDKALAERDMILELEKKRQKL